MLEKKAIKLQKGDILKSHNLIRFCVCLLICCLVVFFFFLLKKPMFLCYLLHVKMEKKITWHDFRHVDTSGFSNIMIHGKSGFMLISTLH